MPKIRRWFPVSQNFNHDPEIREIRKQFGDWAALAWLEVLSIADRNEGIVKGTLEQIAETLAPVSLGKYLKSSSKTSQKLLRFVSDLGWICVENTQIRVVKYAEYHKTREHNKFPSEPIRTNPNLTIPPNPPQKGAPLRRISDAQKVLVRKSEPEVRSPDSEESKRNRAMLQELIGTIGKRMEN